MIVTLAHADVAEEVMEPVAVDVVDAAIKERSISEEVLVEWKEASVR